MDKSKNLCIFDHNTKGKFELCVFTLFGQKARTFTLFTH